MTAPGWARYTKHSIMMTVDAPTQKGLPKPLLSLRAENCAPSPTLAITAKANQMKADGKDVLAFGAGEPDFDTPEFIKQAAKDALDKGYTKYTPSAGIPALKKAICDKLLRDNDLAYGPQNVIVSAGGKHALYNIFQALCGPEDEVVICIPVLGVVPRTGQTCRGNAGFH